MPKLTQQQLETHLWGAANLLRGDVDSQDFKNYILTLMFFKRLSDQWDWEADAKIAELEAKRSKPFTVHQRDALYASEDIHRFKIPRNCHWKDVLEESTDIGAALNNTLRGVADGNPELKGVIDAVDWNAPAPTGEGTKVPAEVLHALVQHFHALNLSNSNVEPDILGRAYEYLIKQFASTAGQKGGEFFTPPEVVKLIVQCLEPQPGTEVYDPTCGSGGMLVYSAEFVKEHGHKAEEIRLRGQELNWGTWAIAKMNMILHGLEADIRQGNTIRVPKFTIDGEVQTFDYVIANFPFSADDWWLEPTKKADKENKKKTKIKKEDIVDPYGRFSFGTPPVSNGDFAFIQHIVASIDLPPFYVPIGIIVNS